MAERNNENEGPQTMTYLNYQTSAKVLLNMYRSCSLVNSDGNLLISKDEAHEHLTTTRLVAFQIVKKYLNPKPQDLFVLNDPENGGYQYSKLIFITCLHPNLFLIWDEDNYSVKFKIPPTPLYDQNTKNDFVWQALAAAHPDADKFKLYLDEQKHRVDKILKQKNIIENLAQIKNQQIWLKATQDVFNIQFSVKANGSTEAYHKFSGNQSVKLKLLIEEKQNLKLITLDFTNTNLATNLHAASHIIESTLVKKIIDFYQINDFFSQSVLDKIKIILPPRSIVSKPHASGQFNSLLQNLTAQLVNHNLISLNSHSRKNHLRFEYCPQISFEVFNDSFFSQNLFSDEQILQKNFEQLIEANLIELTKMRRLDSICNMQFTVCDSSLKLKINCCPEKTDERRFIAINGSTADTGLLNLNPQDVVEIYWS